MNYWQIDRDGYLLTQRDAPLTAFENPKRPGAYLLPYGAVTDQPPVTSQSEIARWNGSAWEIVTDLRGTRYWIDYVEFVQDDFGPLPDGATTVDPGPMPLTLEEKRAQANINFADFLAALVQDGKLAVGTAMDWAKGTVPVAATARIDAHPSMTIVQKAQAHREAAVAETLPRLSPLVAVAQDVFNYEDAQIDAMFGID